MSHPVLSFARSVFEPSYDLLLPIFAERLLGVSEEKSFDPAPAQSKHEHLQD